jgi:DNA invertase Pin-like site-specific DNA recombinase
MQAGVRGKDLRVKRDRPELVKMIEQLRDEDTVVTRLDRLGSGPIDLSGLI